MSAVCTYDDAAHAYYRGLVRLPSVTGIITEVWPRTDGAPEAAIEHARDRGSWVDAAFTEYLMRGAFEMPAGTPQEFADCLGQAIDWWDAEYDGAQVECQVRLFGQREAGTADMVVEDRTIIDVKSTWEISKTVPAQVGGYAAIREESGCFTNRLGVLHVHRRLKKAAYTEINYSEGRRQWAVLRDYWRLTRAA